MDFISIPGFEEYRISPETKEIQSSKQGKWKPIKTGYGRCALKDKAGAVYNISVKRLLYAALNQIDPRNIDKNLYVVEKDGTLELMNPSKCASYIGKTRKKRKEKIKPLETILDEYKQTIQFCEIMVNAYKTHDFTPVVSEMRKYENELRNYMRVHKICNTPEEQEKLLLRTFDRVLSLIRDEHKYISALKTYLLKVLNCEYNGYW